MIVWELKVLRGSASHIYGVILERIVCYTTFRQELTCQFQVLWYQLRFLSFSLLMGVELPVWYSTGCEKCGDNSIYYLNKFWTKINFFLNFLQIKKIDFQKCTITYLPYVLLSSIWCVFDLHLVEKVGVIILRRWVRRLNGLKHLCLDTRKISSVLNRNGVASNSGYSSDCSLVGGFFGKSGPLLRASFSEELLNISGNSSVYVTGWTSADCGLMGRSTNNSVDGPGVCSVGEYQIFKN